MVTSLQIPVGHGRLEALLEEPESDIRGTAVVCHPHPQFGGTMHNNVAYRMAKVLVRHGYAALRFNFRGVGASTGIHSEGIGEQEDVTAAIDCLADRHPALPLWVAGFSFGARVGLEVGARDQRVVKLLGVGLVPRMFDFAFLIACAKPKAFVHAAEDELAELAPVQGIFDQVPGPKKLAVVAGAKHLYPGKLDDLERAIEECVVFLEAA